MILPHYRCRLVADLGPTLRAVTVFRATLRNVINRDISVTYRFTGCFEHKLL